MPTKQELTTIRRAAARARWDAPREKSLRVTVTIPAPLAKKLHAVAKDRKQDIED